MRHSISWKRATKIALVCGLISLPMWASPRGGDKGGRGGDGGCGKEPKLQERS